MGIEGLGGTYGIPAVIKEQETGTDQKKKQKKLPKKDRKEQKEQQTDREGKVDIRI